MATVSFADGDDTNKDVLFRQYVSQPLVTGQTITGAQALKAQCRIAERNASCNMFLTLGIRVIASDGTTVRKTVLAVTRDATEASTTLTNRQFTATSAATNYTTQAGDRLVIEIGMGGDPNNASDHDSDLRLGDSAASDLSEDDASTTDNRPWVQLNDTLAFIFTATAAITRGGATCSASATFTKPVYTATAAKIRGASTCAASATFTAQAVFSAQAAVTRGPSTCSASGSTSGPHPVGKITQPLCGVFTQRYSTFGGKPSTPPFFVATAAVTRGASTASGSANVSGPHLVGKITQPRYGIYGRRYSTFTNKGGLNYTVTAAVTRGASTASGAATFTPYTVTASAAVTRGASTASGSATRTVPTFTASAAVTRGHSTASGSATFTTPVYTASASVTRGASTSTGSALYSSSLSIGEAAVSIGAATASGSATFVVPTYTATASITRTGVTCTASATFAPFVTASAVVTIAPAICVGTARTVFGTGVGLLMLRRRLAL